jgi:ABC-type lipoprotein export system ATPase subunit
MSYSQGSVWRKWDLHIHTPESFRWKGARFGANEVKTRELLFEMVTKINETDVAVFGIMDYWTFDGYIRLMDYLEDSTSLECNKLILPGIELRLEAPVDHRLNTHVLFSNEVTRQQLQDFLATLRIANADRPLSREALEKLHTEFDDSKLKIHGFKPDDRRNRQKMHLLGCMTAEITRDSWRAALQALPRDRYAVIQPYDTSDGLEHLDWEAHPSADRQLMKLADIFETRKREHIDLFLGKGHPDKPEVGYNFIQNLGGQPKPAVAGSDAHRFHDYGNFPSNKATWIKGDPRFETLIQAKVDPAARTHIGEEPPHLTYVNSNPTKYIESIEIRKKAESTLEEHWFDTELQLNTGLVAIIGNKGSGKSALADILALAGNAHCDNMSFLNDERFRRPKEKKASHFEATVRWRDGDSTEYALDTQVDFDRPERVRYLPQKHIEKLCGELGTAASQEFQAELEKVIFSHVQDRLDHETLKDLIDYQTEQVNDALGNLRKRLHEINTSIHSLAEESSEEHVRSLQEQYSLKEKELHACDLRKPKKVPEPTDEITDKDLEKRLEAAKALRTGTQEQLQRLDAERTRLLGQLNAIRRIRGGVENLEAAYEEFLENHGADAAILGISLKEFVSLSIDPVQLASIEEAIREKLQTTKDQIGTEETGLRGKASEVDRELGSIQKDLTAPQRAYEQYCSQLEKWEQGRKSIRGDSATAESLVYYGDKIQFAKTEAPRLLREKAEDRAKISKKVFAKLDKLLKSYRELYEPVHSFIKKHDFVSRDLGLEFSASLSSAAFKASFLGLVNKARAGSFYQDEGERLVAKLLARHDFGSAGSTLEFINEVLEHLHRDKRDGKGKKVKLESQLAVSTIELYDFLYGLPYLQPEYELQMADKELAELSPGERGIILLVFYLLIDRDNIPLIIDQPEENLDNESVFKILVECIKKAKERRQVIIVTHNPNLVIAADAEQIICATMEKARRNKVRYRPGSIENPPINFEAVRVLEGTWPAFQLRDRKYQKPQD